MTEDAGVYVWEPPDKSAVVRLSLDVIDRLSFDIMRAFGAVPRRGAETGGLLLGSVERGERPVVQITEYEEVPITYRRGPSYLLADADRAAFAAAVERCRAQGIVGFFRSHTREGDGLVEEDVELLRTLLPDCAAVLWIRPYATKATQAGFLLPGPQGFEAGRAPEPLFVFRRRELDAVPRPKVVPTAAAGSAPVRETPASAPVPTPPAVASAAEAPPEPPSPAANAEEPASSKQPDPGRITASSSPARFVEKPLFSLITPPARAASSPARPATASVTPRKWIPAAAALLGLLIGGLFGYEGAIRMRGPDPAGDPFGLQLTVAPSGSDLHVRWNRDAPAVQKARRGVLFIQDGSFSRPVDLDSGQLQHGSVVYKHSSPEVRFRLEVYPNPQRSVTEALDWTQTNASGSPQ